MFPKPGGNTTKIEPLLRVYFKEFYTRREEEHANRKQITFLRTTELLIFPTMMPKIQIMRSGVNLIFILLDHILCQWVSFATVLIHPNSFSTLSILTHSQPCSSLLILNLFILTNSHPYPALLILNHILHNSFSTISILSYSQPYLSLPILRPYSF